MSHHDLHIRALLQHTIAQEVELLVKIGASPVIVFAIDNARFVRMKLQTAFSKALLKLSLQNPRLPLRIAVA
jgi:hypothetical protein